MTTEHRAQGKKGLRFKVLHPHMPQCVALRETRKGVWGTPWAYLKASQYRDWAGRLQVMKIGRGRRWWLIGCNCVGCPAEIAVDETSILECLPHD